MSAIKFSKQYVSPNPDEIDYWIDLSANQYGGKWKYFNGISWIDLINPDGTSIDANDYYTKLQINQMLSNKASVESVESKVDDSEIAEVIKNIEFKDRGTDGIEMVVFKFNGTNVGITLPVVSNTTSGIITKETFKKLVNTTQLQELYTEMYDKLSKVYSGYQKKLKAGDNIVITDNNVIHAASKIGIDWDSITGKPDLYDKGQVDTMMSGVYKIKGSRTFEELPTEGNNIGDTYNITNSFTLNGEEYELGTNVVWTEEGWDALAGIFDTSELEEDIQEVKDNYLPLSGGTITGYGSLNIKRENEGGSYIKYSNVDETLGHLGVSPDKEPVFIKNETGYKIYHEGNDGPNSGLNADTLDGIHGDLLFRHRGWNNTNDYNKIFSNGIFTSNPGSNPGSINAPSGYSNLISFGNDSNRGCQFSFSNSTILHARNHWDGEWSPWKTIAFTDYNGFYDLYGGKNISEGADLNNFKTPGTFHTLTDAISKTIKNLPSNNTASFTLVVSYPIQTDLYVKQTLISYASVYQWVRHFNRATGYWDNWILAIADLTNINAPTASKLKTPVKLWGNDFDGSKDIDNHILLKNNKYIKAFNTAGNEINIATITSGNEVVFGHDAPLFEHNTCIHGKNIIFRSHDGNSFVNLIKITNNGNVGIGTTNPLYKLEVAGNLYAHNSISCANGFKIPSGNTYSRLNMFANESALFIQASNATGETENGKLFVTGSNLKNLESFNVYSNLTYISGGNVGIGTTDPLSKLDVNGNVNIKGLYSSESITIANGKGIYINDSSGDNPNVLLLNSSNNLLLGYGSSSRGYKTTIEGNTIDFKYGTNHSTGMVMNSSGNVTIGSTDRNAGYKLDVDGTIAIRGGLELSYATPYIDFHYDNQGSVDYTSRIIETAAGKLKCFGSWDVTNNARVANELYVGNKISSGDLVDWYGVSWYENSSDPTCTRIGNMTLHRSLPILNAMKGYYIGNYQSTCPECILPLNDNWSKLRYSMADNDEVTVTSFVSGNIMVKIPEFWYIDEYDGTTKTHNLKISQTAKAGWCHHKEAYIGAYEGRAYDTDYKSVKGVIPTVSVTRETLRAKARVNGYEDEYKWNIYTYEEHRAICHLFLVEYATRNSQAPVNTALTADGFKQGGLGSGCTTGTMDGAYSFIPTGTTDSLGNGSGQVAYTASNGVTYYANRYRGIENPFGHIWKHVDDIVNVYNTETGNKTVYKCDKPEHFATNKNAKYKPLCSFPGGSKMVGWSKEIKATINCDFFKYSVGGSESTYWCDYNYDNDDTSEHCLLIGGGSGYGGSAGLFCFGLLNGVGDSYVNIGSRLTYLPWAE